MNQTADSNSKSSHLIEQNNLSSNANESNTTHSNTRHTDDSLNETNKQTNSIQLKRLFVIRCRLSFVSKGTETAQKLLC